MKRTLLVLYNIVFVPLFFVALFLASWVNSKIRRGVRGRKNLLGRIRMDMAKLGLDKPKIWIHVSSYGEFLQVKPVLYQLKALNPNIITFITFFSPSGYENVQVEHPVDCISYLPLDSYFHARKFVSVVNPQLAVIVRHDIWPNFVWRLHRNTIPLVLIDATLPDNSSRFWPILRGINRKLFEFLSAILVVSEEEKLKFQRVVTSPEKIIVAGETKYDQVIERSKNLSPIEHLLNHRYLSTQRVLVVGSSWESDESVLIPAFGELSAVFEDLVLIIAPHEPAPHRVDEIKNRLHSLKLPAVSLSELTPADASFKCLIIDRIGILANVYYLGALAFVGGSFHSKIHNVLEPAVYGRPVIFGPKMKTSAEAIQLLKHNAAIQVHSKQEFVTAVTDLLRHPDRAAQFGQAARQTVMKNVGNSKSIAEYLLTFIPGKTAAATSA